MERVKVVPRRKLWAAATAASAVLLVALLMPTADAAKGPSQQNAYTFRDDADPLGPTYNWIDASAGAGGTAYTMSDDGNTGWITLPFTFKFFGVSYDRFGANSNGYVYFNADATSCSYCPGTLGSASTTRAKEFVAGFWGDLNPADSSCTSVSTTIPTIPPTTPPTPPVNKVTSMVYGSAPNRVQIMQWEQVPHYGTSCTILTTFQIRLYETTHTIEVHYKDAASDGGLMMMGIEGPSRTDYAQYLYSSVAMVNRAVRYSPSPTGGADSYSTLQGTALSVTLASNVLLNDVDVDGDPLTVDLTKLTAPGAGSSLSMNADGTFTYTPNPYYTTSDLFKYRPSDNAGPSKNDVTVTITITPKPWAPIANATSATTLEELPVGVVLSATDYNLDPLTYSVVSGPSNGVLGATSGAYPATLIYTPSADWSGTDSFTYKVNDGTFDSNVATATITVTPVPDSPIALDNAYTLDEDTTFSVPALGPGADPCIGGGVLCNDRDGDGDPLTAVLNTGPTHAQSFSLAADGSFTYTPVADYFGTDSFTYFARDPSANLSPAATVTLTIIDIPDPPRPVADTYSVLERTSTVLPSVLGNDVSMGGPLSAELDTPPSLASSFSFNADGTFTYESVAIAGPTTDSFTYLAKNSGLYASPTTVTLNLIPFEPPTAAFDVEVRGGEIRLTDRSTPGDNPIVLHTWDFGDGVFGTGATPVHLAAKPGLRLVTLLVTDSVGATDSTVRSVYIAPTQQAGEPITDPAAPARAGKQQTVSAGNTVLLDGTNNPPGAFHWVQISGPTVELKGADTARPSFVAPTVATAQTLVFELRLFDGERFTPAGTTSVRVERANEPPVALVAVAQQTSKLGAPVTLDGSSSYDPEGEAIGFRWEQLDGPAATLERADSARPLVMLHGPGTATFRLTVSDGQATAASVATVRAAAEGPTARFDVVLEGALARFIDASEGENLAYFWDFGRDGPSSHHATPSHTFAAPGRYAVSLIVQDVHGNSDQFTRWVVVKEEAMRGAPGSDPQAPGFEPIDPADAAELSQASKATPGAPLLLVLGVLALAVLRRRQ
jgi:PKD repeat protein